MNTTTLQRLMNATKLRRLLVLGILGLVPARAPAPPRPRPVRAEDLMRKTCGVMALTVVVALLAVGGQRAAPALADTGYDSTLAAFQVSLGHDTGTLTLATTTFVPSVGVAGAPDPSIDWGDNTSSGASVLDRGGCTHCDLQGSHLYLTAGHYTITITYYTGCCVSYTTSTTVDVITPTDHFVMTGIGDSASSGEGNPDQPIQYSGPVPLGPAIWDDGTGTFGSNPGTSKCHRSRYAPSAEAAQRIQQENITTSIDYTLLACTGATIGIPLAQEAANGGDLSLNDTAIKQLSHLPPGHIDALVIMVGANNLDNGYSNVIETCLKDNVLDQFGQSVGCEQDTTLTGRVASDMAELQAHYDDLAAAIQARGNIGKVYITEYFDPTHNAEGNYGDPTSNFGCTFSSMTAASWQWAHDSVVVPLNNNVAEAARAHGWQFVGGIASQFLNHGFCAWTKGQNWVVGLDSAFVQGDIDGTAHANHLGQQVYRDAITNAIYQGTTPTTTASAGAYTFGTFTKQDVQVTLTAHNQLPKAGVGATYYAVDNPACTPDATATCQVYSSPFTVSGNGNHAVSFFSQNSYGTPESLKSVSVKIDTVPPTTQADGGGYTFGTWTNHSVPITLHAVDTGSGVQSVTDSASGAQSIGQTSVPGDTASLTITNEGQTNVSYFATDNVGNIENSKSVTVKIDETPPQSTLAIGTPKYPSASTQPFVTSAATFTLTASDNSGGSGVASISYRYFPQGSTPGPYTTTPGASTSFTLQGADGWYEVDSYATDVATNAEQVHVHDVYLDNTAPVIDITQPAAGTYIHSATLTLNYTVGDGAGSGVASFLPLLDGVTTLAGHGLASGQAINLLTELPLGTHTFTISSATDNLGNVSSKSVTFTVVVTADSIQSDVNQFVTSGAITDVNWAKSLLAKLGNASAARAAGDCSGAASIYQAFISELQAQSSKNVTATAASVIIADAQYLIAHC
jgi:hypothetical protein